MLLQYCSENLVTLGSHIGTKLSSIKVQHQRECPTWTRNQIFVWMSSRMFSPWKVHGKRQNV